ncbi:glycosyltransferase family A protein [Aeoliella sp.]|uniref:glycosyltransferase family A protein n=1 Tax=Aeoliella sp. TaxID=2795800 RepID=UPI003CCC3429
MNKELGIVTCFFNPCRYRSRRRNLHACLKGIQASGARILLVELLFGSASSEAPAGDYELLRLHSESVMWQKERLLNVGTKELLKDCDYVAWIDADIVFENTSWLRNVVRALQEHTVVSVAGRAYAFGETIELPACRLLRRSQLTSIGSGYGWAYRAELLNRVEWYDKFIVGGGDSALFFTSLVGSASQRPGGTWVCIDLNRPLEPEVFHCLQDVCDVYRAPIGPQHFAAPLEIWKQIEYLAKGIGSNATADYLRWSRDWVAAMGSGTVGFARNKITVLPHGRRQDRRHQSRRSILPRHKFDPKADIVHDGGAYSWSSPKPDLHREVLNYFSSRKEDD